MEESPAFLSRWEAEQYKHKEDRWNCFEIKEVGLVGEVDKFWQRFEGLVREGVLLGRSYGAAQMDGKLSPNLKQINDWLISEGIPPFGKRSRLETTEQYSDLE